MQRVIVAGGGVGGLAAALALGRAGHPVTVVEQDPLPATADAEEAFAAERRGAPQVHQTHGFLARLQVVLRDRFPDVLDDLLAVGCTTMTGAADLGEPQPGDEDLEVLIVRRTTLEWVLRQAALRRAGASSSAPACGVDRLSPPTAATVTGVRLDDGTTLDADLVVACHRPARRRAGVARRPRRRGARAGPRERPDVPHALVPPARRRRHHDSTRSSAATSAS